MQQDHTSLTSQTPTHPPFYTYVRVIRGLVHETKATWLSAKDVMHMQSLKTGRNGYDSTYMRRYWVKRLSQQRSDAIPNPIQ